MNSLQQVEQQVQAGAAIGGKERSRLRTFAAALALGSAGSVLALGLAMPVQAQIAGASLRGTVKADGGVSSVTVVSVDTGFKRTATVGADGSYNFPSLPIGSYRLDIATAGGVKQTDNFTLQVGQSAVLDFDFTQPQSVATSEGDRIIVSGNRIRSMEGGEVGTTITQRMIEQLPQNNRNFLAFADLAPGVQFITGSNDQSRLQGGAQGSSAVNIFIDGVGQKDYVLKNGITGQDSTQGNPFPQLAIGEYRVISSNYKAEFDQVSSVAITAVTKSGTNEFHGEAFADFTNYTLRERAPNERYPTLKDKVHTKDFQFGGALGGPIIKDVLHFFVTYEGKRRVTPRDVNPGLSLPVSWFPTQYQDSFGPRSETFNENLYFGKLNFTPTQRDLFEVSLKFRDENGETFNSGSNSFETRTIAKVEEWRGLARWEHSGDNWVNDFKIAYENVTWGPRPYTFETSKVFNAILPNDPPATGTRRGDILRVGGGNNFQDKGQEGWMVSDDFTYTGLEGHTFKAGVKAKWVTLNMLQQNYFNPLYRYNATLNGTGTFNDTIPYQVVFTAPTGEGDPLIRSKNFQFGIYAQDDWDVTDRLTLNIGVRWDYERSPGFLNYVHPANRVAAVGPANYPNLVNADYDINDYISTGKERKAFKGAWQPRLGFTYALDEEHRFAIFGGYGRSYDRTQFDFIRQELAQSVTTDRTFNFYVPGAIDTNNRCTPSVTCIPWNPIYLTEAGRAQLVANAPAGAGGEMRFINNKLKTPYSDQFSLGVRGRFELLNVEVGYSYVRSKDGFVYLLGNRQKDGSFWVYNAKGEPGSPFGISPAPFGNMLIGTNGIETRANTAYLKLGKRYTSSSPWSLDATYTFTDAEENRQFGEVYAQDFPSMDDYPFLPSTGVRKHRLVMAGTVDVPLGLTISGKFQIASPKYVNQFVQTGGATPSRQVLSHKTEGNGDLWGFRQMDLSVTKYVPLGFLNDEARLRFRVDIINLFNDRNYNGFNSATGLRDRNNWSIDGVPRTIKVAAGFSF